MKPKIKQPLLKPTHLPLSLLGWALALFGLVSALLWSFSASQAMRGLITAGQLRTRLASFELTGGLVAGILFFGLFIWCARLAQGGVRAAFIIGSLSALAPILAGRAETLLFDTLALRLPAGSVVAGALVTILFALPMIIFFIILASSGRVPTACRWLALAGVFIVLGTAFYPIYVTVLAFLIRYGDATIGPVMEFSTQVIKLRYILPGLVLVLLAYFSQRFSRSQAALATPSA